MNHINGDLLAISGCFFGLIAVALAGFLKAPLGLRSPLSFLAVFAAAFVIVPLSMALNHRAFDVLFPEWSSSGVRISRYSPETIPAGWAFAFPCALLEFLLFMDLFYRYRTAKHQRLSARRLE